MVRYYPGIGLLLIVLSFCSAQSKYPAHRFSVLEIDGAVHILRSPDGPYRSFDELPAAIKARIHPSSAVGSRKHSSALPTENAAISFVVSDPSDAADSDLEDGLYSPPTLRSAIQNANLLGGSHTISFASGLTKIQPSAQLPAIDVNITIDGAVSAGKIVIDGFLSSGSFGLSVGKPSVIKNMKFEWWKSVGLGLAYGANNSVVQNNEFSFNNTGLNINADSVVIGGDILSYKNIASVNTQDGIAIVFANNNLIQNNFSGTFNGSSDAGNYNSGVYVQGERNKVISNILSGNDDAGLEIGEFSKFTLVWKNHIGVNETGTTRLPNSGNGITTFADRDSIINNVITGNAYGITVLGQSSQSYIGNNIIGLNAGLDSLIGNRYSGMQVLGSKTLIEKNTISANKNNGIEITGLGEAVVRKNYIGTDPTGTKDWGNTYSGIYISCNKNVIGGEFPVDQNIISGNDGIGIELYGGIIFSFPGPSGPNYVLNNSIQYNYIGTTKSGNGKIPNSTGIVLQGYVDSTLIYNNLISGNLKYGIWLQPGFGVPSYNYISANYIGTILSGTGPLPNTDAGIYIEGGTMNIIGGPTETYSNTISGNSGPGVWINGGYENTVKANLIGLNASASSAIPNVWAGVRITGESEDNIIHWNHISGNNGYGISVESSLGKIPYGNVIIENTIGLNSAQTGPLPNTAEGVYLYNAQNTWIGGITIDSSNFISGNLGAGILIEGDTATENSVWGNYIGTDGTGFSAVPNERGVVILNGRFNRVGGTIQGSGNLISGNVGEGIYLYGADSNQITRNIVGLTLNETAPLPNNYSGIVIDSSDHNMIGLDLAFSGNSISGNKLSGIVLMNTSHGNRVYNNFIGTDFTGTKKFGNTIDGINVYGGAHQNWIGKPGAGNLVRHNVLGGILIADSNQNRISGNSIEGNGELGIDLLVNNQVGVTPNDDLDADGGANDLQNYPVLFFADGPFPVRVAGLLRGKPNETHTIEFFEADAQDSTKFGEGKRYIGAATVTTDSLGFGIIQEIIPATVSTGNFITATATDFSYNTSEFSRCVPVRAADAYADINVVVKANRDSVRRLDTVVFHITVTNNGPDSATSIVLKDTLGKRLTYIADSTSKGTRSFAGGVLTVTIPAMKPNESVSIVLVARADSLGVIVNTAFAAALQSDYEPVNNTGRDTVVVPAPLAVPPSAALPTSYALSQNYPNPFNPATNIRFEMPVSGLVSLKIFDLLGREITTLISEVKEPGRYSVVWNGTNVASGVYFYRLQSGDVVLTKKLLLQK